MTIFRRPFSVIILRVLWLAVAVLTAPIVAQAERVALVIGNANYSAPGMTLRNPGNDVDALSGALRDLGFIVVEAKDEDAAGMAGALDDFATVAAGAEMAVFFYAGHGVQIAGENHLIGVDFAGNDVAALQSSSVTMSRVRDVMAQAKPGVGVMILDACRNNPFADNGLVQSGLAQNRSGAGLLIAYATDPGNVAYDGVTENSVFTASLLHHIATPGLDARLMFGRVRQEVVMATAGRQVPWVEESVLGEYAFAPAGPETAENDAAAVELARWRHIAGSANPAAFEAYLADYPGGLFESIAQERVAVLAGAQGGADPAAAEVLLASADPDRVAAALTALGVFDASQPDALTRGLGAYQRQLAGGADFNADRLYVDAARESMFLAAATLQRLRTDLVALRSVEGTLGIAEDALGQIADIAATNPDAAPILAQATADVADIRASYAIIQARLDQSRSYYDEILGRAVVFFPDGAQLGLQGADGQAREIDAALTPMVANTELFLRHVTQARNRPKGSYQWLAELISTQ